MPPFSRQKMVVRLRFLGFFTKFYWRQSSPEKEPEKKGGNIFSRSGAPEASQRALRRRQIKQIREAEWPFSNHPTNRDCCFEKEPMPSFLIVGCSLLFPPNHFSQSRPSLLEQAAKKVGTRSQAPKSGEWPSPTFSRSFHGKIDCRSVKHLRRHKATYHGKRAETDFSAQKVSQFVPQPHPGTVAPYRVVCVHPMVNSERESNKYPFLSCISPVCQGRRQNGVSFTKRRGDVSLSDNPCFPALFVSIGSRHEIT